MVLSGTGGYKTQGLTTAPDNHGDTTPGSASMYAKLSEMEHRFQRHFDAQEQTIKDLRREVRFFCSLKDMVTVDFNLLHSSTSLCVWGNY